MRFLCWLAFALMLWTPAAQAQVAVITGQAEDQDSQLWFGGTYQIKWVNPQPGFTAYRTDTLAPFPQSFLGSLDGTGSFSVNLTQTNFIIPVNSQWQFTICSGVTGWQCGTFTTSILNSQSVSSQISAVITAPRVTGGPGIRAYSDIEVSAFANNSYFNLTSQINRCYSTSWAVCGGGGGGAVSSVFGRAGAVVAQTGDYTCSEVTGCPTATPVSSVFGRTGAITAQTGDYTCSQVTGCISSVPVTSVFGRMGAITAQQGDYNCLQVTNCGSQQGFISNLATNQGASDTTMVIGNPSGWPVRGTFAVDSEYETYTARSGSTLSGITRGVSLTTPASHFSGTNVTSVDVPFGDLQTQLPTGGIFGVGISNPSGVLGQQQVLNCGSIPPAYGTLAVFIVNCEAYAFEVDNAGSIHQYAAGSGVNFFSPFYVGPCSSYSGCTGPLPIEVNNSNNLVQTNASYQFSSPMGFSSTINGPLRAVPVPNLPAPIVTAGPTGGSCSLTYEIVGVDADGNSVLGTPFTVNSLTFPSAGSIVTMQMPLVAGIVTYYAYRTAETGCGGLALGQWNPSQSVQYPQFEDAGSLGDGTSPPSTNTSVAKMCVGSSANPELYCTLSGTSGTPPVACTSSTSGWNYYNTAAVSPPYALKCISGSWTDPSAVFAPLASPAFTGLATATAIGQSAANAWAGQCTMAAATTCTVTLGYSFTAPICTATQQGTGAVIAGECGVSGTTATITAGSSNSATWAVTVFGNPN